MIIVGAICLLTALVIPALILKSGYRPDDDALYHAAKVISGKSWNEILVLRDDIKLDPNLGWHNFLGIVHNLTGLNVKGLLIFAVIFLFFLFCATPSLVLKRPEAWLLTLLLLAVMPFTEVHIFERLLRGRPYIITMTVILLWGFLWPRLKDEKKYLTTAVILAAAIALATYLHCSWYLFAAPLGCLFLAREWRAGAVFTVSVVAGVTIGAALTGHPIIFFGQTIHHMLLALGTHTSEADLVEELRPAAPSVFAIAAVVIMLFWRRLRGSQNLSPDRDPVLIMIALCLVGDALTRRIWFDLGRPALCVWLALEFQDYFESIMDRASPKRILLTVGLAVSAVILVTSDSDNRWSHNHPALALSPQDKELAPWLPGDGGIIYNDRMWLFYEPFYEFPHANWRYVVGFEPGIMPAEDLTIFRNIQSSNRSVSSYTPWIRKMRPEDRLMIASKSENVRLIKGLEWFVRRDIWIGRLPAKE